MRAVASRWRPAAAVALPRPASSALFAAATPPRFRAKSWSASLLVCLLLALAPFAAWTARNWRVFHLFEPLAPHYATEPGEDIHLGWKTWFKTWSLDFVSTYDVSWNVPDGPLDLTQAPRRAFDSPRKTLRSPRWPPRTTPTARR